MKTFADALLKSVSASMEAAGFLIAAVIISSALSGREHIVIL